MLVTRFKNGQYTISQVTEEDMANLQIALDAALFNSGKGVFGGTAPWKPEFMEKLEELRTPIACRDTQQAL